MVIDSAERQLMQGFSSIQNWRQCRCSDCCNRLPYPENRCPCSQELDVHCVTANHELHDNMEQPGRCRAHSGRLAAKISLSGCSS